MSAQRRLPLKALVRQGLALCLDPSALSLRAERASNPADDPAVFDARSAARLVLGGTEPERIRGLHAARHPL